MELSLQRHSRDELESLAITEFSKKARYGGWLYLLGASGCVAITPVLSFTDLAVIAYLIALVIFAACRELAYRLVNRSQHAALRYFWLYVATYICMASLWTGFSVHLMYVVEELRGGVAAMVAATSGFAASSVLVMVPHFRLIAAFSTIMLFIPMLAIPLLLGGDERWFLSTMYGMFYVFLLGMGRNQSKAYWHNIAMTEELKTAREEALAGSKAKSAFLANMSHEIRTPMNGVMGMVQLLEKIATTSEQREYLQILHRSSETLLKIIDDILIFSRLEADKLTLQPEPCDVDNLLREMAVQFQRQLDGRPVELKQSSEGIDDVFLMVDPVRLQQVLYNLIGNAVKFTQQGSIELRAELLPLQDDLAVVTSEAISLLKITVSDTGEGIPPSDADKIFQEFHQVSNEHFVKGTGLGLAISNRLLRLMGGRLDFASEVGKGSRFWFEIPVTVRDKVSCIAEKRKIATLPLNLDLKVLVVEDNPVNQAVIKGLLEHLGCQVKLCDNGRQAVTAVTEQDFDVILMDCDMPEMDGFEATRHIRQWEQTTRRHKTPIYALTAHVLETARLLCWEAGMDECLTKPISLVTLSDYLAPLSTAETIAPLTTQL